MEIRTLGRTGIRVSELCMGLLPIGPSQADLEPERAASLIRSAWDRGITFFDTAKSYRTQNLLRLAMGDRLREAVVSTKSPATDGDGMAADVEAALGEMGLDRIDIFLLHAARDDDPFHNREGALRRLHALKRQGVVRAVGVSTHLAPVARAAAERDDIDVLFALNNLTGMGVMGGTRDEMTRAMERAAESGTGVFLMKPLAGGNLVRRLNEAFAFARGIKGCASVSVGMVTAAELKMNLAVFDGKQISPAEAESAAIPKRYIPLGGCTGCGTCVKECASEAVSLVRGQAVIDSSLCIRCGYCALACPGFWIRAC